MRELIPFGVLGAALFTGYSIGATVYVPHLFSTYATRYGVIGAVFAMISTLFCVMVILVVSAAAGREVRDELERIRRGEQPPTTRSGGNGTRSPPRPASTGRCAGAGAGRREVHPARVMRPPDGRRTVPRPPPMGKP